MMLVDARSWLARQHATRLPGRACPRGARGWERRRSRARPSACRRARLAQVHCGANREGAWGFKLRATPARWRVSNEAAIARGPFEFGWELMQLLVEEAPGAMCEPAMLANLMRYLLYGRAPHKERACLLLLRTTRHLARVEDGPVDSGALQALEQLVGWHDAILRQGQAHTPLEGTALLPTATQCLVDLLAEVRERMLLRGVAPTPSSLQWMSG